MKSTNPSRRNFIKKLAASTATFAVGTNLLTAQGNTLDLIGETDSLSANLNPLSQVSWDTLRGHFCMGFVLDPPADNTWEITRRDRPNRADGEFRNGAYLLKITEKEIGREATLIDYELTSTDGSTFQIHECRIECKNSYSGVYKIFTPGTMCQQNYHVDLPFFINDSTNAELNQPVIWMQQTDGRNTLLLGMLNQVAITEIKGSTYDTANGGEAPGIANSYVRVTLNRILHNNPSVKIYKDTLYVNADPDITWFEALTAYGAAVDTARNFQPHPVSKWALNPMWHSWYAHADRINEKQIREDFRRAHDLGATTIEIDAGWNIPSETSYSLDGDGDYEFDKSRFPDAKGMIKAMHSIGQRVILHVSPLVMGKNCKAWVKMNDCRTIVGGKPCTYLDPRLKKVHDYLLTSWENMFTQYDIDGLWYDFLEIPDRPDKPAPGFDIVSPDIHVAYTKLLVELYNKAISLNSNALIILRRGFANLNAKVFCTHVWPSDTPQDYNMNRRDIVYMKTFGPGVLTHACCTSWSISERDVNVARQMASIVLAGVPAFSVKLDESPETHNAIIKAWLSFYELNKEDFVYGQMIPLLPTPPSAALRIEGDKQAFFGFFEAIPGLIEATKLVDKIVLINAFNKRTVTRLEGLKGTWQLQVYDHYWHPTETTTLRADTKNGMNINITSYYECHSIILTKRNSGSGNYKSKNSNRV